MAIVRNALALPVGTKLELADERQEQGFLAARNTW
jgi:hypothetical protein